LNEKSLAYTLFKASQLGKKHVWSTCAHLAADMPDAVAFSINYLTRAPLFFAAHSNKKNTA